MFGSTRWNPQTHCFNNGFTQVNENSRPLKLVAFFSHGCEISYICGSSEIPKFSPPMIKNVRKKAYSSCLIGTMKSWTAVSDFKRHISGAQQIFPLEKKNKFTDWMIYLAIRSQQPGIFRRFYFSATWAALFQPQHTNWSSYATTIPEKNGHPRLTCISKSVSLLSIMLIMACIDIMVVTSSCLLKLSHRITSCSYCILCCCWTAPRGVKAPDKILEGSPIFFEAAGSECGLMWGFFVIFHWFVSYIFLFPGFEAGGETACSTKGEEIEHPVGALLCLTSASALANCLPHLKHLCGFSPVCNFSCLFKSWWRRKVWLHVSQLNGFFWVWIKRWDFRLCFLVNTWLHFPHANFLSGVETISLSLSLSVEKEEVSTSVWRPISGIISSDCVITRLW